MRFQFAAETTAFVVAGVFEKLPQTDGMLARHVPQVPDDWQGQFLLFEVRAQRLAGGAFVADQIEQIVGDLKGKPEATAKLGKALDPLLVGARVQGGSNTKSARRFCRQ